MPKREYLYLRIVDGDRESHYVKTMKLDATYACVVHRPAQGRLPASKEISLSGNEGKALYLANQIRANRFVVDVVPVERLPEQDWLAGARDQARKSAA